MQLDPASGWCQGVCHCPSPNFNARPNGEVSLLVIHNISLPPGQFATGKVQEFFQNRLDVTEHPYFEGISELRVSAHFLIERDGKSLSLCLVWIVPGMQVSRASRGVRPAMTFRWGSSLKAPTTCRSAMRSIRR